jgi:hypothetical protein
VVDDDTVYWTDIGDGSVRSIPKSNGAVTVIAQGQQQPKRLAVDGTYVYWSNFLGAAIMRARKDGSGSPELVSAASEPWGLVVDQSDVYWVDAGTITIRKAPIGGGSWSTVYPAGQNYSDVTHELNTDGTYLFTVTRGAGELGNHPVIISKSGQLIYKFSFWTAGGTIPLNGLLYGSGSSPLWPSGTWVSNLSGTSSVEISQTMYADSSNACALFGAQANFTYSNAAFVPGTCQRV